MDGFGISVNQASTDLNRYIRLAPANITYDKRARTYIRGIEFDPLFLKPDAGRCVWQLRSAADGFLDQAGATISQFPFCGTMPTPARDINVQGFRSVISAIRRFEAVEVTCQSFCQPELHCRWTAPHAIAFGGIRRYARAFCLSDGYFKDFPLSWMLELHNSREVDTPVGNDCEWNGKAALNIALHPRLAEIQTKAVSIDYGLRWYNVTIRIRRALLPYVLRHLGLDADPSARAPEDQQIVLLNRESIHEDHG
jgi:hypothetical protein